MVALHRGPFSKNLTLALVFRGLLASSRLDPSASLDFLWACIHVPRIWQGRDQRTPQAGLEVSPAPWVGAAPAGADLQPPDYRSVGRSWYSMSRAQSCSAWWS